MCRSTDTVVCQYQCQCLSPNLGSKYIAQFFFKGLIQSHANFRQDRLEKVHDYTMKCQNMEEEIHICQRCRCKVGPQTKSRDVQYLWFMVLKTIVIRVTRLINLISYQNSINY